MARKERGVQSQSLLDSGSSTTINVLLSNATIWTNTFKIGDAVVASIGSEINVLTGGSAKMTVVVEQSHERPTAEYSAHPSYVITDTIMNTFSAIAVSNTHSTVSMRGFEYARCKITSSTPNTSAYIKLTFTKQLEG